MKMARVFLPEQSKDFNLKDASRYGDIAFLSDHRLNPFNPIQLAEDFVRSLKQVNFDPNKDYICMTGKTLILSVMFAVVCSRHKKFNILIFDARNSTYAERIFEVPS